LGETGENSNHWGYEVIQLCESNDIGWNWWTHKKLEKITSPLSAIITPQYQDILDYWNGNGSEPSTEYAQAALFGMAISLAIENCESRPGVIPALMDPTYGESPVPVTAHSIPGTIAAVDYDIGARNVAYTDEDYMNTGNGGYNWGWSYRNDGVDIEANGNENGLPYNVGWTSVGEWIGYTIEDVTAGTYDLLFRVSSNVGGGIFFLELNGTNLGVFSVPNTGGWWAWETMTIPDVIIGDEPQYLKLMTVQEGYNIEGFTFSETADSGDDGSEESIPESFTLGNYPNPFNSQTTIFYDVPSTTDVNLSIYDINGVQVKRLYSGLSSIGENKFIWNGVNDLDMLVSSGVYFYRLESNDFVRTRKMVLIK
jgi:hypothetical protein